MKTPRIHDFDPDAKVPELNSPLDGMPAIQKPHPTRKEAERQDTSPLPSLAEPQPDNEPSSNLSRKQDSFHASKHASTLATTEEIIETIRKVVKAPAKEEVLYMRITREEKLQLKDIEHTYQRLPIATSANELGRIAVNFLIADYKVNGKTSILAKVLEALRA
jgi:hypothetical protein